MIFIITAASVLSNIFYIAWAETITVVSTRNHFDKSTGNSISIQPYNPIDNEVLNSICMRNEVAVYVHGVWTNERGHSISAVENAQEIFERLKMSLEDVGYNSPLVDFSWDSDTKIDPEGEGWNIAKIIAKKMVQNLLNF